MIKLLIIIGIILASIWIVFGGLALLGFLTETLLGFTEKIKKLFN